MLFDIHSLYLSNPSLGSCTSRVSNYISLQKSCSTFYVFTMSNFNSVVRIARLPLYSLGYRGSSDGKVFLLAGVRLQTFKLPKFYNFCFAKTLIYLILN